MIDEPAFPKAGMPPNGLTKREAYAMAIAPTLLTGVAGKGEKFDDLFAAIADAAFAFADAMIAAGKVKP